MSESEDVMASQLAAKELASRDFRRQLEGYGLTTAQILYRLPPSPSLAAALCLAGLRPLPGIPGAQPLSAFLAGDARGPAAFGHGRPCPPHQAHRNPLDQRRIPFALIPCAITAR